LLEPATALAREIADKSADKIAQLVRSRELSAREVTEAFIHRIEQVNPRINAVVLPLFDEALKDADRLDRALALASLSGPLCGVPVTIKESIEIASTPSTLGLTERVCHRAAEDAVQVARLKQAGAIVLGKTNVSLLLRAYETDNPVYGRTNNPWNLDRAPGGSSGGEGAIVAAGGCAFGLGSDLGGSARLPAHACGVHALRPTSGRLTMLGHARVQAAHSGAITSQPAPIARHVCDLAVAMRVLPAPGQEDIDPTIAPIEWHETAGLRNLRVGFYTDNGIICPAPAVRRAVREAARALENIGVNVVEWRPPDLDDAWEIQLRLTCADGLASYRRALTTSKGAKVRLTAMPGPMRTATALLADLFGQKKLATTMRFKQRLSIGEYMELLGRKRSYSLRFLAAMDRARLNAILCPPDALPALKHGSSYYLSGCTVSYPGLYSLLGMPAGVVAASRVRPDEETERPVSRDMFERAARRVELGSAGLPIGVQVVARHWREDVVLAIMQALEDHFRGQPDYPELTKT
jgi:fatty acid amide hydrolase